VHPGFDKYLGELHTLRVSESEKNLKIRPLLVGIGGQIGGFSTISVATTKGIIFDLDKLKKWVFDQNVSLKFLYNLVNGYKLLDQRSRSPIFT